jgi:myosin heavy subunit
VFPLLSEECRVPKGSDQGFLAKVTNAHARSRSFVKSRPDRCDHHHNHHHQQQQQHLPDERRRR